jgi:hypothetical protein
LEQSIKKKNLKKKTKQKGQEGRPREAMSGPENMSRSISKPSNQHGERLAPKFSKDELKLLISDTKDIKTLREILETL